MVRTRSLTDWASAASPRSGLAAVTTRWPCATSGSITPFQLADSAKAPWTRTMVGRMGRSFRLKVPAAPSRADRIGSSQDRTAPRVVTARRRDLRRGARLTDVPQRCSQLLARPDVELGEHLAQVVFDRTRADEELGADLGVRASVDGQARDLRLLRRQLVERLDCPLAHALAGRDQLAAVLASQPFAVEQLGAGAMDDDPGAGEPL